MTDPNFPDEPRRPEPPRPEPPLGEGPGVSYPQPPPPPAGAEYGRPDARLGDGQPYLGGPVRKSPVLSILSLIAGIVGLVGSWIVILPIIGSILDLFIPAAAVVLGFLGRRKEPQARGMWLAGIILGFVALAIAIIALVLWIVAIATANANCAFNTTH
jgi:hypothetical protein